MIFFVINFKLQTNMYLISTDLGGKNNNKNTNTPKTNIPESNETDYSLTINVIN